MNCLKAIIEHIAFMENKVEVFDFQIDNSKIQLFSKEEKLYIEIIGRKNIEKLQDVFFDIISLLFIYLGSVPKLCEIIENDLPIDISKFSSKYTPSNYFYRKDSIICQINAETLKPDTLKAFCTMNRTAINSLQFLLCESYNKLASAHRITLLLHVIDGVISNNEIKTIGSELRIRYSLEFKGKKIGEYLPKVYYLCKNYFFNFHQKFNCNILQLLKKTRLQFIQISTDTRNDYSHLSNKKTKRLKNGDDMLIWFEILHFAMRLMLASKLNIALDENIIKEHYYVLHDWISNVKYNRDDNLKSNTYKINKSIEKFRAFYLEQKNK